LPVTTSAPGRAADTTRVTRPRIPRNTNRRSNPEPTLGTKEMPMAWSRPISNPNITPSVMAKMFSHSLPKMDDRSNPTRMVRTVCKASSLTTIPMARTANMITATVKIGVMTDTTAGMTAELIAKIAGATVEKNVVSGERTVVKSIGNVPSVEKSVVKNDSSRMAEDTTAAQAQYSKEKNFGGAICFRRGGLAW